ncbi:Zinc finger protein CONSTANS-LIKE 16 [Zea mays]|uniref:Zinc finger protein CONSTANS-LIKE 16 n=1 Tax=Zea mays TaxID=4577 RepID=A0A317YHP3_MAIZE|nr:Zinc finger protein CONSTANS-LIKE 16 [Zea mays]
MTNAGAATGSALGARTARSCDSCMRRRARWHCPADNAFLCQTCDVSVHSANPLARRHHRVRLPSASCSSPPRDPDAPTWLHGLKRRPRTPRSKPGGSNKHEAAPSSIAAAASAAVPDLEAEAEAEAEESGSGILGDNDDDHGFQDDDEDLLYCVPVFDPMLAEFYNPVADEGEQKPACLMLPLVETSPEFASGGLAEADGLSGFDVPDMDLASFAADMESLLMGVDDGFDDLGFLDEQNPQVNADVDLEAMAAPEPEREDKKRKRDGFDYLGFLDEEKPQVNADVDLEAMVAPEPEREDKKRKRTDVILKLNYEGVIASWVRDGGSPWYHGERPHLDDPYELWLEFPATGSRGLFGGTMTAVTGGEREARVSRYREKRRRRLFAKKIRYEVRKLNAEKRPRMKGRFVKRTTLPPLPRPPPPSQQQQKKKQLPRALPHVGMVLAPPPGADGRFRF